MKHQSVKDRMHEGEGMVRHHMRHGHMAGPSEHFHQSMREESSHRMYRNQVEMPEMAAMGHPGPDQGAMPSMGMHEFKGEADPIAYGQASMEGCRADEKRMHSQFKDYHWD